jgi:hypothetical protein
VVAGDSPGALAAGTLAAALAAAGEDDGDASAPLAACADVGCGAPSR